MAQQNRNQKFRGCKDSGIYQKFWSIGKFNFGNFFNSIIFHQTHPHSLPLTLVPPLFCWGKNRSSENAVWEEWVISFCLVGNDFINSDLRVEIMFRKLGGLVLKSPILEVMSWRKFHADSVCFFITFVVTKKPFWPVLSSVLYRILLICLATV